MAKCYFAFSFFQLSFSPTKTCHHSLFFPFVCMCRHWTFNSFAWYQSYMANWMANWMAYAKHLKRITSLIFMCPLIYVVSLPFPISPDNNVEWRTHITDKKIVRQEHFKTQRRTNLLDCLETRLILIAITIGTNEKFTFFFVTLRVIHVFCYGNHLFWANLIEWYVTIKFFTHSTNDIINAFS